MSEGVASQEKRSFQPMMFMPETDSFGRGVNIDNARIRLNKNSGFSSFSILRESNGLSLSLSNPDGSEQIVHGKSWFVYGDYDTNSFYIASTAGNLDIPKQTLLIGPRVSANIVSFKPDRQPDYKLTAEKSLQPLALILKDSSDQFVIFRRYNERINMSTNTVSLTPSSFEITSPNMEESKVAATIIAEWQSNQKSEIIQKRTLHEINELARIATLRLAHKYKNVPPELKSECKHDPNTNIYSVSLYVSEHGKARISGKEPDMETEKQVGDEFGFGSKLIFVNNSETSNDSNETLKGSIQINSYSDENKRTTRTLVDNLKIIPTNKTLSTELLHDKIGGPVYEVSFSSTHADDIINVLVGIDRGLKPRYMPPGELGAT